ncbi:hypothetical protein GJ744_003785 [Endocarpon pusillum]|uniref:Uncharacterized protein n=1 Tax=Endocarpon pusillum TaxID=364733 RepID=A0A8H7AP35_9EURO|nr:hypothetical protein GJ744_003785 [Endocarpon pusillum]
MAHCTVGDSHEVYAYLQVGGKNGYKESRTSVASTTTTAVAATVVRDPEGEHVAGWAGRDLSRPGQGLCG